MADIHHLRPVEVGDGAKVEADKVLSAPLGKLESAVVIGWDLKGELYFASSDGCPDTLWLIEQAKKQLLEGED